MLDCYCINSANNSKMKVIAVLGVILAVFRVAKADISQEIAEGASECANMQKLDKKTAAALRNELEIPEDNVEYTEFYGCLAKKVGTVDEDGNVVAERLKDVLQQMQKKKLGDIPDVDAKAQHMAVEAFEKCKDVFKGDSVGQSVVKIRNCIHAELQ